MGPSLVSAVLQPRARRALACALEKRGLAAGKRNKSAVYSGVSSSEEGAYPSRRLRPSAHGPRRYSATTLTPPG
jgi:hypothetical protein